MLSSKETIYIRSATHLLTLINRAGIQKKLPLKKLTPFYINSAAAAYRTNNFFLRR